MCLFKVREMQHYKVRKENWVVNGGGSKDVKLGFVNEKEMKVVLSLLSLKGVHVNLS